MEKVYSKISKVLVVCIVVTIIFTLVRIKMIETPEVMQEIGENLTNVAGDDGKVGDVEGYAAIIQGTIFGFGVMSMFFIVLTIAVIGVIQAITFIVALIFMQVCKALETSIDPEKWKKIVSKILFWIYIVAHVIIMIFDIVLFQFFMADAIIITGAFIYNLYLYFSGRKKEKLQATTETASSGDAAVGEIKSDDGE